MKRLEGLVNLFKKITYVTRVIVALALVLTGLTAHAVRMGPLSVDSALGEPLKASIVIYDASELDAQSVTVSMASPSSYDVLGLIYNDLISRINLRFENTTKGAIVYLSTEDVVNEVVIDLQVDLVSSGEKVSRTYVAFIDPPLLVGERRSLPPLEETSFIDGPKSSDIRPEVVANQSEIAGDASDSVRYEVDSLSMSAESLPKFVDSEEDTPTEEVVAALSEPKAVRQIVVRSGDTLTKIAQQEGLSGFSLEQMLVGIFRKNREAFVADNMNRLRAGNVIRIPADNELQTISPSEARNEIRIQMADWRTYRDNLAAQAADQGQSIVNQSGQADSGRVGAAADRVSIDDSSQSSHVVKISKGNDPDTSALAELQERLLATEKALEEQNRRADDLEKIIANLKLLTQKRQTGLSGLDAADPPEAISVQEAPVTRETGLAWQAKLIQMILAQPLYLFIPVALLLIIGLWVSKRLNRMDSEDDVRQDKHQLDSAVADGVNPSIVTAGEMRVDDVGSSALRNQDPIEDADIFLAYGRYPQAEKILKEVLVLEPERLDVLLKLAEVYSGQKNLVLFDEIAHVVSKITNKTGAYWERLVALGYLINPSDERYADGKFASKEQPLTKPFDLSSIDLNLGDPPPSKS